jgi:uncharacterized protein (TIGR03435 family)
MRYGFVCLVLASGVVLAQAPGSPLSFEVASIRPVGEPPTVKDDYTAGYNAGRRAGLAALGLRVRGQNVDLTDHSLKELIRLAYGLKNYQIAAPGWMEDAKFDIMARMPAGATRGQAPEMLRALLEHRFHLAAHREARNMTVYALFATVPGATLIPTVYKNGSANARTGRVIAYASSVDKFAEMLSIAEKRPVIDSTGITGLFDFDLTYSESEDGGPSLATALREKFGLRLERRQIPVEVLVVERADKFPTEN